MFRTITATFAVIIFFTGVKGQLSKNLEKEIRKIIYYETAINFNKTPGFIVGVVVEDSMLTFPFGKLYKDSSHLIADTSIFEIGAVTHSFTAELSEILHAQGKIYLDSSVNSYLPTHHQNPSAQGITVRNLLTHTSGLPVRPTEFGAIELDPDNPYAYYTKSELLDFYKDYEFQKKEIGRYHFSNINYALAEIVIENALQRKFTTLMKEELVNRLDLESTGFDLPAGRELAPGYDQGGERSSSWTFTSFEGALGLRSTVLDLMQFVEKQWTTSLDAIENTHEPYVNTGITKNSEATEGWYIISFKNYHPVIVSSGMTEGHSAFIAFVKETKTGVVILSNSPYAMDSLGILILRMLNNNWR